MVWNTAPYILAMPDQSIIGGVQRINGIDQALVDRANDQLDLYNLDTPVIAWFINNPDVIQQDYIIRDNVGDRWVQADGGFPTSVPGDGSYVPMRINGLRELDATAMPALE